MIDTLKTSFKIDTTYSINSFIYLLKKTPIFKDLIVGDSIYKNNTIKSIIRIFVIIFSLLKNILFRVLYILIIYIISHYINEKNTINTFIHIYFILTILGMFINNKLLNTSTKKYFSIILFNIDAKKYLKSNLYSNLIFSFIINFIVIFFITNIKIALILSILSILSRIIGEALNIWFYKKKNKLLINNLIISIPIIIILSLLCLLPKINILIDHKYILLITIVFIPIAVLSYIYINKIKDYKLIYKKLNTINKVMNKEDNKLFSSGNTKLSSKDIEIDSKKLKNKKGYDLFNRIFFERHKSILLSSAIKYTIVISILIIIGVFLILNSLNISKYINNFILTKLSWAVIVMYFINRGAILTQAMFYNCDHAMLTYNFYREPKIILNLFKKRLLTIVKINIIPAIIISIGLVLMLYLSGGTTNIINYISIPILILSLSVFFSTHYLVIYYLLQPYNKDMKIKSVTYMIISILTYFVSYRLSGLVVSSLIFSMIGVLLSCIYIIVSLILVYNYAPRTFKIR